MIGSEPSGNCGAVRICEPYYYSIRYGRSGQDTSGRPQLSGQSSKSKLSTPSIRRVNIASSGNSLIRIRNQRDSSRTPIT